MKKYITIDGIKREFTPEEYLEEERYEKEALEAAQAEEKKAKKQACFQEHLREFGHAELCGLLYDLVKRNGLNLGEKSSLDFIEKMESCRKAQQEIDASR